MNDNNKRNNTQLNIPHSKNKSKDTKPLIQNINSNNLVIQETQKQKKNILNNGSIASNFINKYILKKIDYPTNKKKIYRAPLINTFLKALLTF